MKRSNFVGERPISPHLSIYKLQLTSGMSIFHRITGAYLYVGLVIFAWAVFMLVYFPYVLVNASEYIYSYKFTIILFKLMVLGWTFSLFYHLLNGIRHLFWDAGKGFELKTAYLTGRMVIILSVLFTIACYAFTCNCSKEVETETIIIEETK